MVRSLSLRVCGHLVKKKKDATEPFPVDGGDREALSERGFVLSWAELRLKLHLCAQLNILIFGEKMFCIVMGLYDS